MNWQVKPEVSGICLDAEQALRDDQRERTAPVYGLVVHTSGGGIVDQALRAGADVTDHVVTYYRHVGAGGGERYYAHYVGGYTGRLAQIADEHRRTYHVGLTAEQRQLYLSGAWADRVDPEIVRLWRARWPHVASPSHLYPGPSVNEVYVGIELPPVHRGVPAMAPGLIYTREQHDLVADLAFDIARRWGWPVGWQRSGRLVGHEDVGPLDRSLPPKGARPAGGWDPGGMRWEPWLDWSHILEAIDRRLTPAADRSTLSELPPH